MKTYRSSTSTKRSGRIEHASGDRPHAGKPSQFSIAMAGLLMLGIAIGHGLDGATIDDAGMESVKLTVLMVLMGFLMLMVGARILFRFWAKSRVEPQVVVITPMIVLAVAMVMIGMVVQTTMTRSQHINVQPQDVYVTGHVKMVEVMTKDRQRTRFHPDGKMLWQGAPDFDLRLITPSRGQRLRPGDVITGLVTITPPLPQLLPGSFDFTAHAHRQGYAATGFIKDITIISHRPVSTVAEMRAAIQKAFFDHLDKDQAAVASAVIIGLRAGIDPDVREDYRAAGLAHLLAISGLHMALFWGSVMALIRLGLALFPHFASRYPSLKIAAVAALPFGLFYLVISGQPISAVRAFLMLALVMLAIVLTRRGMTLHYVALVAMGILILSPDHMLHPAFQMSFAAVYALVIGWMVMMRYRHLVQNIPWLGRYIGGIVIASLLASGASAPFVLHHFGMTTIWSVLANIIGMPLMGVFIIPFGAMALVLMPIGLEGLPLAVMGIGIDLLNGTAAWVADRPLSKIILPPPSVLVLVVFTAALLWPACVKGRWRAVAILPLLLAIMIWVMTPVPMISFTQLHGRSMAAFHADDGQVYLSHRSINAFAAGILLKPFGQAAAGSISDYPCPDCGRGYQRITLSDGRSAAMVYRRQGFTRACNETDIVMASVEPKYPCRVEMLITSGGLDHHGGVLIFSGQPLTVRTVQQNRPPHSPPYSQEQE